MISLAQYLTQYRDEDEEAPAEAASKDAETFTPLRLVKSARPRAAEPTAPKAPAKAAPEMFSADPESAEDARFEVDHVVPPAEPGFTPMGRESEPEGFEPGPADDVEERLEAARREAREAALAEAEETHAAELCAQLEAAGETARAEREAALAAAREEWAREEGERLAGQLGARLDQIAAITRTSLTQVLRPLAMEARTRQSLAELAEAADLLIADGEAVRLIARGPEDLLEAFRAALGGRAEAIETVADPDAVEITIACDQTKIETRLAEWRRALCEVLS